LDDEHREMKELEESKQNSDDDEWELKDKEDDESLLEDM